MLGAQVDHYDTDLCQTRPEVVDAGGTAVAGRCTIELPNPVCPRRRVPGIETRRKWPRIDPHRNTQDRRSLKHREKLLRNFVAYWRDRGCPWPMRSSLVLDWIAVGSHRQHPYRDQRRFYVVRAFLQQIRTFESATEIPENIYRPLYRRRTPHLYSEDDIARLMDAVWQLQTVTPFRRATVYALIGLLASTGLRIGEALALNVDDVKLSTDPPHLLVSNSKFGNSRNVVLHPSVAKQLRKYLIQRSKALASRHVKAFFIKNRFGRHLNYNAQRLTFLRLLRRAGIRAVPGQSRATFHSFFSSLIRGEETDPLASREKETCRNFFTAPSCVSRSCWPGKHLLVSKAWHSRTPSGAASARFESQHSEEEDRTDDCPHSCRTSPPDIFSLTTSFAQRRPQSTDRCELSRYIPVAAAVRSSRNRHVEPIALKIPGLDAEIILRFLDALEKDRGNTVVSRNLRLTAIRSFYRMVAHCVIPAKGLSA